MHTSGTKTPQFNISGHVIGPGPNLTRDLRDFVHEAQRRNILVTLTLWNCASVTPGLDINLHEHKYTFELECTINLPF